MKMSWLISRSFAGLLLMLGQGLQAQPMENENATAEERGRQHFVTYLCASCHGFTGQGGQTDIAPKIRADVLSTEALIAYVRNPGGNMPAYRTPEQIPDEALQDIHAYLKSVPPSPAAADIPLLNQ